MVYTKPFRAMKYMAKKGKMGIKSVVLEAKSGYLAFKKYDLATKLERLNGAKCRLRS